MQSGWQSLGAPVGEWRSQLLWRGFGFFVNQVFVMLSMLAGFPLPGPALAIHACGLLLLLFGPRPLLLIATTASAVVFFEHMLSDARYQVAEEYVPLVVLPLLGSVIALGGLFGPRASALASAREMDRAQVSLFRVALLVMMSFAALHKLNTDFFDPALSCAMIPVPHRLVPWVEGHGLLHAAIPYAGFAGEAGIPLLLFLYPRLGIPFTVVVMSMIGHQGATPFTTLVMVCSLAFLRPGDGRVMWAGLRRYRLASLAVIAAMVTSSFMLFRLIGAKRPWLEYLLFEVLICVIGLAFVHVLIAGYTDWRAGGRWTDGLLRGRRGDPLLPGTTWVRGLLAALVSGMSPYLGLKFRLSFEGQARRYVSATRSAALAQWIREMDVNDRLWQPELPLGGPQKCIH